MADDTKNEDKKPGEDEEMAAEWAAMVEDENLSAE